MKLDSKALLESTKESARVFLEDLEHLRDLIGRLNQSRGEIRRASAILRRLLIEGDLSAIAAPRIGKLLLAAPDNTSVYRTVTPETVSFFLSGGAQIFGLLVRACSDADPSVRFRDFDPDRSVELKMEYFLRQRVLFWKGKWIERAAIIKFVANVAHGVHAGTPKGSDELLLADARHAVVIGRRGTDGIGIAITHSGKPYDESRLEYSEAAIDLLLIELFAAARYLVESPAVLSLETAIRDEIAASSARN